MAKRANGEGLIRKRANGTWEARYTVGYDEKGKQITRSIYGKKKEDVAKKLNAITNAINTGVYIPPDNMTVGEWCDIWTKDYLGDVKESTVSQYKYQIRVHIKPCLGSLKLQKVTTHMVQMFYNDSMKEHKNSKGKMVKGLSAKSVKNLHCVLHEAFQQAVMDNYIKVNPCDACKPPRAERKEIKTIESGSVSAFLSEIAGKPFEDYFKVALFTGMRKSELLGLQWQDVNFDKGFIFLSRQLKSQRTVDGKNVQVYDTLKNGKTRTIYPSAYVFDALRKVRKEQAENHLKYGKDYENTDGLVFTNELGEALSHSTVYHHYKDRVSAIGLPNLRLHDLRHTFATLSIQNGDDIKTVSENLGHATVAFTLDTYAHVTEEMKQKSADRMQEFIKSIGG